MPVIRNTTRRGQLLGDLDECSNEAIQDLVNNIMQKPTRLPGYLFVLPWSPEHVGGVNQVVINLALQMQESGTFDPIILINSWDDISPRWGEYKGLQTVRWRIRERASITGLKGFAMYWFWERRFRRSFKRFCVDNAITTINPHYITESAHTLDRILDSQERPLLLLSLHGADLSVIEESSSNDKQKWRTLFRQADGIIVCSDDLGKRVVAALGNDVSPLTIHNGIDVARFVVQSKTDPSHDQRIILNVAKFEHKKGQDVLIRAFNSISKDHEDLTLNLVGAKSDALPSLRRLCIEENMNDRVNFYLDIPHGEMPEFFRRATIFVLPSRQEPFGIVLLEAGCFTLPVVASNVGGIPEVITDGVNGHLVEPGNPRLLALRLRSILDNPDHARTLGENLRSHVAITFSWKNTHDKYHELATGTSKAGTG